MSLCCFIIVHIMNCEYCLVYKIKINYFDNTNIITIKFISQYYLLIGFCVQFIRAKRKQTYVKLN